MATYAIDCGHTLSGSDYGAVGIKAESNLTREVGKRVIDKLKSMGNTAIDCTLDSCSSLSQSLGYRVNKANSYNLDLFVSIHFNCFNGSAHGTEVFTYGGKSFTEANRVLNNLASLGFTNRGIKDGSNLYVLKHTKAKAMLIECCFCDNSEDMSRFNAENMANAIVKGITGKVPSIPTNPKEENKVEKLVIYHYPIDQRAAEYLADKLNCPTMWDSRKSFDYSSVKKIYAVGGLIKDYPTQAKIHKHFTGDRYSTCQSVINYNE
ncbi:TPA: N-acetylmuramoyl-L-alanine amidase [Clostridium botulinum]